LAKAACGHVYVLPLIAQGHIACGTTVSRAASRRVLV
jgi:hypothetical protein